MNKFLKSIMAIAIAAFVFTGCVEDPCETIDCGLNGIPTETSDASSCFCECINGFDGPNCDELATGKFIGNWDAADVCPSMNWNYFAKINPFDGNQEQIQIFNLAATDSLLAWTGMVSGDSIIVPLSASDYFQIEGVGVISAERNTINWNYNITDSYGSTESCTGVWTKVE